MMSPAYSLIHEEWIPCRFVGGEVRNLGLREVFLHAHNIEEIHDPSPLVTTALLRLHLALLYCFYPAQNDEHFTANWKRLWYSSSLATSEIDTYFEKFHERFFLFHGKYPFYQTPGMSVVKGANKSDLIEEEADNIFRLHKDAPDVAVSHLFDHRHLYESRIAISAAEAARLLIAAQNYGTSSSQSGRYTLDGQAKFDPGGRQNGLLFKGIVCWLTGRNLKETLLLNWVRYVARKNDRPCWENADYTKQITSSHKSGNAQVPAAPLDLYTWQARMVRLMPTENQGSYRVSQIHFTQGRQAHKALIRDPMKFYMRSAHGEEENVLCMKEEKASWRDVHALLQFKNIKQDDTRPQVLRHIAELLEEGDVVRKDLPPLILNISGFVNDKAKLVLWRHERLALPVVYLENAELISRLGFLLDDAEQVEKALLKATKSLCSNFLAPGSQGALGEVKGSKKPDPAQIKNLEKSLSPTSSYWGMLETEFHSLLFGLAGTKEQTEQASSDWKDAVQSRAKQAFGEAMVRLGNTPQVYKAGVLAKPDFRPPSRKPESTKSSRKG